MARQRLRALLLIAVLAGPLLAGGCGDDDRGDSGGGRTDAASTGQQVAVGPPSTAPTGTDAAPSTPPPEAATPSVAAVPILMYHVIGTPPAGTPLPDLWVGTDDFAAQIDALAAAGFEAVTLSRVLDAWAGRATLPRRPVVVSFDDGYLGQGKEASAILGRHRWPGVLNLALHNLGVDGGISTTRLKMLVAAGWEIGSHSLTHPDMTRIGAEQLRTELVDSRRRLRELTGQPIATFCYPAGRYDATVERAVRAAGYRAATTVEPGLARPRDDRMALPRVRINRGDSPAEVVAKARGNF